MAATLLLAGPGVQVVAAEPESNDKAAQFDRFQQHVGRPLTPARGASAPSGPSCVAGQAGGSAEALVAELQRQVAAHRMAAERQALARQQEGAPAPDDSGTIVLNGRGYNYGSASDEAGVLELERIMRERKPAH